MSNLGLYQTMTTVAKKVGGPVQLLCLVGATGYAVGKIVEMSGKEIIKTARAHTAKKALNSKVYTVHAAGESNEGLKFRLGDQFRVLENDGDAVLIDKIGETNNPYFVSADLLHTVSDY